MPWSVQQPSVVSGLRAFSAAVERSRGTGPRATIKNAAPSRRARALGCDTRIRAGFPRHAPVCAASIRGLWAAGVFRSGGEIAGDRPPRYEKNGTPPPHRRARACPSPCPGLRGNPPWSLVCGRFPQWWRDRGGQAPARRWRKAALHRRARACPSPCLIVA